MSLRILVTGTAACTTTAQISGQIADLLEGSGDLLQTDATGGLKLSEIINDPERSLQEVAVSLRSASENQVLINGIEAAPAPSFDVFGWNLDVAANVGAQIVLVINGSGMSEELLHSELKTALSRAEKHHATVSGVVLVGIMADVLSMAGTNIVSPPLTADKLSTITGSEPQVVTPLMFQSDLLSKAAADLQTIVLPEPEDHRILQATAKLLKENVAKIVLVGDETSIKADAAKLSLDLSDAKIVSPHDPQLVEKYATEFARLRAKKGVTIEQAREKVQDVTYFATMMVQMGDADGMVSGAIHTTANTIVPAFQIIKTAPDVSIVSSSFLMLMADKVLVMGDCAVNPNPTPEQLAEIAVSSAQTAKQFGLDPRVAMLSYSTGSSGAGADVEAVTAATAKVRQIDPTLQVEGPIQYDAAVAPEVAASKAPDSAVAGRANVLIFPTLNAGNIGYKAVQRSANAVAVGPILQGLRRPVNDLSRGALVEDIVNTVAITAIQAQGQRA